jgi:quercetin dioxygenase-like cupin family protein
VPGGTHEVVLGLAEIPAGLASIGRHTHFGSEIGTVIEGGSVFMVEGQPDREVKAGDSYQVGSGVPHDVKNGATVTKVIAVYVVEKGKPLATPAPAK